MTVEGFIRAVAPAGVEAEGLVLDVAEALHAATKTRRTSGGLWLQTPARCSRCGRWWPVALARAGSLRASSQAAPPDVWSAPSCDYLAIQESRLGAHTNRPSRS